MYKSTINSCSVLFCSSTNFYKLTRSHLVDFLRSRAHRLRQSQNTHADLQFIRTNKCSETWQLLSLQFNSLTPTQLLRQTLNCQWSLLKLAVNWQLSLLKLAVVIAELAVVVACSHSHIHKPIHALTHSHIQSQGQTLKTGSSIHTHKPIHALTHMQSQGQTLWKLAAVLAKSTRAYIYI